MFKKLGITSISDVIHWIVTLSDKFDKNVPEAIKQRMPGFLGLSLDDERILEAIRTELSDEEDHYLTAFLIELKDYEQNRFRNIVAGIPTKKESVKTGEGKNRKTEIIEKSNAAVFLRRIARLSNEHGPEEARKRCLSSGTIVEDPLHQKALRQWKESVIWFKRTFLDILGVESLSEIKMEKIDKSCEKTANWLEQKIAERRATR